MNGVVRKTISVVLLLVLLIVPCVSLSASAEKADVYTENGQMDMDVVFVLDASGSMLYSDPNKVALDAVNLFVDLCDESCSVGYVVYSEKIVASSSIISLSDQKNLKNLKENIGKIEYDPNGDTDIALGLTKAMNLHSENQSSDPNRKKVIVLLSDGNTHLINGPRTVAESNKELSSTLQSLNSKNIPVYSIGLNYDNTLDKKELEKISAKTNGKFYETNTSDKLTFITSDIFSDIYKLEGTECEIKDGNAEIYIKDNSVFYVNIIIRTDLSLQELNPVLTSPGGDKVSLTNNDNVKMTSAGSYTLIKLIYPESGKWNLHLDNATKENCKVTQLDFYSVYIKQIIPESAGVGESIEIKASLNDSDGVVNDVDLLETITMTAVVTGSEGETTVELTRDFDGVYSGEFTADTEGEYTIKTTASSEKFEKESAAAKINISLHSLTSKDESSEEIVSEPEETDSPDWGMIFLIIGIVIILIVVLIIAYMIWHEKMSRVPAAPTYTAPEPVEPPKPKPQPTVQTPAPAPPDLKYVNVPLVEHDTLENLIKKGSEDAFNANPDDYQTNTDLEALIRKGPEDPFNTNADSYETDASLAAIIKTGGEGLGEEKKESAEKEPTEVDEALASLIKTGGEGLGEEKKGPAGNESAEVDEALASLIKTGGEGLGEEAKASARNESAEVDEALASLIKTGGEGLGQEKPFEEQTSDENDSTEDGSY